jgi:transposase-like protein
MKHPTCPNCGTTEFVRIYDEGVKRFFRSIAGNNRFYCKSCMSTWRMKQPDHVKKMKKKKIAITAQNTPDFPR